MRSIREFWACAPTKIPMVSISPRRSKRNFQPKRAMEKETMASTDDKPALKITLEDLASVQLPAAAPAGNMAPTAAGSKQYGNIAAPADGPALAAEEKGHLFLQGWFYLGLAGLLGALVGWGICEPFYRSPGRSPFLSFILLPLVIMFTCT